MNGLYPILEKESHYVAMIPRCPFEPYSVQDSTIYSVMECQETPDEILNRQDTNDEWAVVAASRSKETNDEELCLAHKRPKITINL